MGHTMFAKVMKELAAAFVSEVRKDTTSFFVKLGDEAAPWLRKDAGSTVMREIHEALDDRLPNDWIYQAVSSLADAFVDHGVSDADEANEATHEIADGLVDVYNHDRLEWLASHLGNAALVDEACKELECDPDADTFTRIGLGQFYAYERLAHAIIGQVTSEADSRESEES